MRYADTLLSQGEVVILRTRQHPLALLIEARAAIALWLVAIVLIGAIMILGLDGQPAQWVSIAALACLALGLVIFGYRYWAWWAQDFMITNRRLIKVTGILNKRSSASALEKINDAILNQNVVGRILNYGDMDIITASGDVAVDFFDMLNGAKEFKRVMLNQKHALEMEYMYGRPPTPPLRAAPMDMNGEPTRTEGPAAGSWQAASPEAAHEQPAFSAPTHGEAMSTDHQAGPPEPVPQEPAPTQPPKPAQPAERESSALEITRILARLADLRDRGAISTEDYEAKKQELLSRL